MNHSVQPVEYVSPVPSSTVADAQTLMSQWIALQHSQQQVNDRFLRLQERMLFGNVDGAPLPTLAAPQPRALIAAPPAPAAAPAPLSAASVTPVSAAHAVHTNGSIARPTSLTPARGAITLPARAMEQPPETPRLRDAAGSVARPVVASAPAVAVSAPRVESNGHAAHAPATPATPAAHAPAAADSSGPPSTEQFTDDLLRVISERTGYPIDMLDKDLPLEAGLGIDSIKTVEVFSKLKIYHPYFQRPDQDEEEVLKVFTRLKTLRDIINLYDELRAHHLAPAPSNGAVEAKAKSATPQANGSSVKRFELQPVEAVADGDEKKNHLSTTS